MAKLGTEFEKFTKSLYEKLLNQHSLKNLRVEHDILLRGTTGQEHQIDVYWEFELAGITHKVAVECKDYKSAVSVGKIRDFSAVLDYIGGIKGIFLTKQGYQSGALTFAKGKGISLKIVKDQDISIDDFVGAGLVTQVILNAHTLLIDNVDLSFEFDNNYILQQTQNDNVEIKIDCTNDQIFVLDKNKEKIFSIYELTEKLSREPTDTKGLVYEEDLTNDIHLLDFPNNKLDLKINKIRIVYDTVSMSETHTIIAKATAKAIIRDILDGTCEVVGVKKL